MQKKETKYDPQSSNHLKNILNEGWRGNYSYEIIERIKKAIGSGANPNIVSAKTGRNALSFALEFRDSKFLDFLIKSGLNANVAGRDGNPILFSTLNNMRNMQLLLMVGADPNRVNNQGQTPLIAACIQPSNMKLDLADTLLRANANVFVQDNQGDTALHVAVRIDSAPLVKRFFNHDNCPPCGQKLKHMKNQSEETPLTIARAKGNGQILALLQQCPQKLK